MIREAIGQIVDRVDLTQETSRAVMMEMMSGEASPGQIASFITAMRMKGETEDELVGIVRAIREHSVKVRAPKDAIDLCGTGGDGTNSFNISTVASFVAAGAGVPVAKHGNRSISSRSGSADLLSILGVPLDLGPEQVEQSILQTGLGFMFAPVFHSSMRNVMVPRREIGVRTFFNIIGPMTNPAGVRRQLIGVYDPKLAPLMARILKELGTIHTLIVHGNGMDEITNTGDTKIVELRDGKIDNYTLSPSDIGIDLAEPNDLIGGDSTANARIMYSILRGERSHRSDIVAMNAAAAVYVAGIAENIEEALEISSKVMRDGSALNQLDGFLRMMNEYERESQERIDPEALLKRRILPAILVARSEALTRQLVSRISEMKDGPDRLSELDERLLSEPSVLSVIALRRLLDVMTDSPVAVSDTAGHSPRPMSKAIEEIDAMAIIGEYKPRSPSSNPSVIPPDPLAISDVYAKDGLTGISVLTEPNFFGGSSELFSLFRERIQKPILYKDFIVHPNQLDIASHLGADAVLLIAKALSSRLLDALVKGCLDRGMEPLIEVHDEQDIHKLTSSGCIESIRMIGVNCRDLRSLKVDPARFAELREKLPDGKIAIAESGLRSPEDVRSISGFDAVLVGTMFMISDDVGQTVSRITALSGRSAR